MGPEPQIPPGTAATQNVGEWSGYLNILQGGTYTFYLGSDDGSDLYLAGNPTPVVAENTSDSNSTTGTVTLTPGYNSILTIFDNETGRAGIQLMYSGPDTDNQPVIVPEGTGPYTPGLFQGPGPTPVQTTISSVIGGSNSLTVGGGEVVLPLANTYTGTTYLAGGILNVGTNTSLGTSRSVLRQAPSRPAPP